MSFLTYLLMGPSFKLNKITFLPHLKDSVLLDITGLSAVCWIHGLTDGYSCSNAWLPVLPDYLLRVWHAVSRLTETVVTMHISAAKCSCRQENRQDTFKFSPLFHYFQFYYILLNPNRKGVVQNIYIVIGTTTIYPTSAACCDCNNASLHYRR